MRVNTKWMVKGVRERPIRLREMGRDQALVRKVNPAGSHEWHTACCVEHFPIVNLFNYYIYGICFPFLPMECRI
jgi:hypothetical protein